ncbi:hypothetical protein [Herbaspirillum sp. RV1423]|uniref:hypothetical protein n=1 Tax=Herbaspirillum sp. RV1423 TaxID=1443993 RepID=UPI0018CC0CF3|nr:hypothetical protein [Herbaspirillum sp. RV1423]
MKKGRISALSCFGPCCRSSPSSPLPSFSLTKRQQKIIYAFPASLRIIFAYNDKLPIGHFIHRALSQRDGPLFHIMAALRTF